MRIAVLAVDVNTRWGTGRSTTELIRRLAQNHEVWVFASAVGAVEFNGARVVHVPTLPRLRLLRFCGYFLGHALLFEFWRRVQRVRFDLVWAPGLHTWYADVLTSHTCHPKWVRMITSGRIRLPQANLGQRLRRLDYLLYHTALGWLERRLYHNMKLRRIICVSAAQQRDIVQYYRVEPQRTVVVHHGVDTEAFHPCHRLSHWETVRLRHSIAPEEVLILFAGGEWERKNLASLIGVMGQLPPQVRLLVLGAGDVRHYGSLAQEAGAAHRVLFLPHTSEIQGYYAAADIFCLPSIYESFGLVVLEAMASGLPVVVNRGAGVDELITHGADGMILEEPTDLEELRGTLLRLIESPSLREAMGERARRTAEAYPWEVNARRTEEVLLEVARELGRCG